MNGIYVCISPLLPQGPTSRLGSTLPADIRHIVSSYLPKTFLELIKNHTPHRPDTLLLANRLVGNSELTEESSLSYRARLHLLLPVPRGEYEATQSVIEELKKSLLLSHKQRGEILILPVEKRSAGVLSKITPGCWKKKQKKVDQCQRQVEVLQKLQAETIYCYEKLEKIQGIFADRLIEEIFFNGKFILSETPDDNTRIIYLDKEKTLKLERNKKIWFIHNCHIKNNELLLDYDDKMHENVVKKVREILNKKEG